MNTDTAFEMAASTVRFGVGVTREVGMDLKEMGARLVLVLTDPLVSGLPPVRTVLDSLEQHGVSFALYNRVRVEPTDASFLDAIEFARASAYDAYVAVGGGSTIDTAKAANLYATYPPADFLDYVNPPIGRGLPVPGPVKTLMAIPTTAGTGSETTGVAIFDFKHMHAKTGIANRHLKPTLGYLDPDNTRTMPSQVAASAGLDVLSHAVESYTAMPYTGRPRPERPALRPAYQGSNPISDIWSLQALRMVAQFLVRAVEDPSDDEARANMLLAASYAGIGFGNAGVHLPHGMSYPVSGNVKSYRPPGYVTDHPLVPHGVSVDPQCACCLPLHGQRQSAPSSAGRRSARGGCVESAGGRRREDPRGADHLVHATTDDAERLARDWLLIGRHPGVGRRHTAAASRDQAVAPTRGCGPVERALRRGDGGVVRAGAGNAHD